MTYIFLTFLSGIVSACISIYFRTIELKNEIILIHKQFFLQLILFIALTIIFGYYFNTIIINLELLNLSWFFIYFVFSSFAYYLLQVLYEAYTGNSLFAKEEEIQKYLEKIDSDM